MYNFEDIEDDLLNEEVESYERYEHFRFIADKGQSLLRIDKFLIARIENISRNRIQQASDNGFVLVNGQPVKSNYKVKPDDRITIELDRPRREVEIIPENIPLHIVYEDDDVIVVDKPAGLVVHPGHGHYSGTLVNAIAWHLKDTPAFNAEEPQLGIVHRIDKDTSGLLVVAKNPDSKTKLCLQFFHKSTQRKYIALVWGNIKEDTGTIEGHIGRHLRDKVLMAVFPEGDHGKPAVTHYKILERFGYTTLIECQLETGRTHQIRVHLKHIGHVLFNDARYGGDAILKGVHHAKYQQFVYNCFATCPRQALHAQTLGFIHPKTEESMIFHSDLPDDLKELVEKWRNLPTLQFN